MGLDTVELVMEFEDTFGITIPNADAENLVTPRLVADYIASRLPFHEPLSTCPSAYSFYRLRTAMTVEFGVARTRIRPKTRVADLVAIEDRLRWFRFAVEQDLPRPRFNWFKPRFVSSDMTVADLLAPAIKRASWFSKDGLPLREKILAEVIQITAKQMDMSINDVKPDSHFINDLHMG